MGEIDQQSGWLSSAIDYCVYATVCSISTSSTDSGELSDRWTDAQEGAANGKIKNQTTTIEPTTLHDLRSATRFKQLQ